MRDGAYGNRRKADLGEFPLLAGSGPQASLPKAIRGKSRLDGDRPLTGSTANSHYRPKLANQVLSLR